MNTLFGDRGPSLSEFYKTYWQRKPLHIKGGGKAFLDFQFNERRFLKNATELGKVKPPCVVRGGEGVVFLQNMDLVDDELRLFSETVSKQTGWPSPWFDSVLTKEGSAGGIGSHFDDSDNFVFQISGTKRWRLSSPDAIPPQVLRHRMLKTPGVGSYELSNDPLGFLLEPGDTLYIPLYWIHHGISPGDSLSISLVSNTQSAVFSLLPLIKDRLTLHDEWWQAHPQINFAHIESGLNNNRVDIDRLWRISKEESFERMWDILSDPVFKKEVKQAWLGSS